MRKFALKFALATAVVVAVLVALNGCFKPPLQPKLSAALTGEYLQAFRSAGVTNIEVADDDGLSMALHREADNGRVTARGQTIRFSFPRGIGGLEFPFTARLSETANGQAIEVYADIDRRATKFSDALGSVSRGINVALSEASRNAPRNVNEASWK